MIDLIKFFGDHVHLLLDKAGAHLAISALAIGISLVVALPLGVVLGHQHRGSVFAINVSNVLRSLPSLAIIAISLAFFGVSLINIEIALIVLAVPPILTNAYTAVEGVNPGIVEAARGMGMTDGQILFRVELPNALPLIMTGVRTAWVYVVATAYLAVFAGSPGTLGDIIGNSSGYGISGIVAASLVAIVLALGGSAVLGVLERGITPRGLTVARGAALATA